MSHQGVEMLSPKDETVLIQGNVSTDGQEKYVCDGLYLLFFEITIEKITSET